MGKKPRKRDPADARLMPYASTPPDTTRAEDTSVRVSTVLQVEQRGPLPSAAEMAQYRAEAPEAYEHILRTVEVYQQHQMAMDLQQFAHAKDMDLRQAEHTRQMDLRAHPRAMYGLIISATLAILLASIALILALTGHDSVAIPIFTTTIVGVCAVIILRKGIDTLANIKLVGADETSRKDREE